MARKNLFHPCDSSAKKNTAKYKDFTKPALSSEVVKLIGRAIDKGTLKLVEA